MKPTRSVRHKREPHSPSRNTTHTQTKGYTFAILSFFTLFILLTLVGLIFMVANAFNKPYQPVTLGTLDKAQHSAFLFPTQSDSLIKGQTYTLTWRGGPPTIESMHLVQKGLSNQGVSLPVAENAYSMENTGSYEFTVPETIPNGLYRIEAGPLRSDYFEVKSN